MRTFFLRDGPVAFKLLVSLQTLEFSALAPACQSALARSSVRCGGQLSTAKCCVASLCTALRNRCAGEDRSQATQRRYAPRWNPRRRIPPAAMETETKVSMKTMKEIIRSAGLGVADLLERSDVEARYKQAQARLEEAERLERQKNQPKKRRIIEESSDDDDDDNPCAIPKPTGNKKSNVAPFAKFRYQEAGEETHAVDEQAKDRRRKYERTSGRARLHLAREKASKAKKPPPKKRRGAFAEESEEEERGGGVLQRQHE